MTILRSILLFALAAVAEIGGAWLDRSISVLTVISGIGQLPWGNRTA
jgi:drug/metabolite transporter superfamily protein YnfA